MFKIYPVTLHLAHIVGSHNLNKGHECRDIRMLPERFEHSLDIGIRRFRRLTRSLIIKKKLKFG